MVWPYTTDGHAVDHESRHAAEDRLYELLDVVPLKDDDVTHERNIRDVLVSDDPRNEAVANLPRKQYAAMPRMNASSLKAGMIGSSDIDPTLIRAAYEMRRPEPSSELQASYDRGTLTHLMLLEPENLVDGVAVWKGDRRAGTEWKQFNEVNRGKLIMREADVREVQQACRAVRSISQVNALLRRPRATELAVFGKCSKTYLKGLIDSVTTDDGPVTLIDLKTTSHGIEEESVLRTIRKLHYREQLALYRELYQQATGREVEAVYLLFVALDVVGVRLVKLTTAALQFGMARMRQAIEAVEVCLHKDEWPVFFAESFADVNSWEVDDDLEIEGL